MKIILFLLSLLCGTGAALAQTDIYIRGSGKLFPIALPQLCVQGGESGANREIPRLIARDLDLSGFFEVLNAGSYVEAPGKCAGPDGFAYSDWSVIGAEGLVRGIVSAASQGTIRVQMFLHDVQKQRVVLGKEYTGDESQVPRMAHKFANEIMKFFTGQSGIFGSQISFSSRVGRFKELFVMDMDGGNVRQLTNDKSLAISASWERSGRSLIYTSYFRRVPDLFMVDSGTRRVSQLTANSDLEIGARFSHDGSKLVAAVSQAADSDIVLLNSRGQVVRRLTTGNGAIDVSPDWSPDDSRIVFCSNRSGGPQIYVMNADGSNVHRISHVNANYCTSPRWSPKGGRIAFVCRADSGFQLFTSDADGGNALQLTSYGNNEDPDWSPDGRYLVFSSTLGKRQGFSLAMIRADGGNLKQLTFSRGGDFQPNWGPVPE